VAFHQFIVPHNPKDQVQESSMVLSEAEPRLKPNTPAPYRMLDMWRGIAALWVVMCHACTTMTGSEPEIVRNPFFLFSLSGQLGVMMFFVISGYCIAAAAVSASQRPRPLLMFFRARLRRIYPPYFASSILMLVFVGLIGQLVTHHIIPPMHQHAQVEKHSWKFYFAALTLTQVPLHVEPIIMVYWSLCYEIAFYGIVGLALLLINLRSRTAFFACLNVVTVGSLIWLLSARDTCPFPLTLWFQFGMGAMVYQIINYPRERANKAFLALTLILAATFAARYVGPHDLAHPSSRSETLFCAAFTIVVLWMHRLDAAAMRVRAVRGLAWLGTISYSLYLTHPILRPVLQHIGEKLKFTGNKYGLSFLLQITADIGFAFIFFLAVEKRFLSSGARKRDALVLLSQPTGVSDAADDKGLDDLASNLLTK